MQAEESNIQDREWAGVTHLFVLVRRYPVSILLVALTCALLGFVASTRVAPSYRSTLYLGLENQAAKNPVLDGLNIPTGTQNVKEAYSLLRSDDVLSLVVSGSHMGDQDFRMGLQTQVTELAQSAWQRLRGLSRASDPEGGLGAQFLGTRTSRETAWRLFFDSDTRVRIAPLQSTQEGLARVFGPGLGPGTQSFDLGESSVVELEGVRAKLSLGRGLAGRTFELRWITQEEAIRHLRRSLQLVTPGEREQVLRVVVQNSQPHRAQELGRALADAFLHFEAQAIEQGAKGVVSYLEGELGQRKNELDGLDRAIALHRSSNPDLLHPEQSAQYLQARRLALQTEIEGLEQKVAALESAKVDPTNRRVSSMAPAQRALMDPAFDRWLARIDALDGALKEGTIQEEGRAQIQGEESLVERKKELRQSQDLAQGFAQNLDAFIAGDEGKLSSLLAIAEGSPHSSAGLIKAEAEAFRKAQADLQLQLEKFTVKHPGYTPRKQWLEVRRAALVASLKSQAAVLDDRIARARREVELLTEELAILPAQELAAQVTAREDLWEKVEASLAVGLEVARERKASLQEDLEAIDARHAKLPVDRGVLDLPLLEREGLRTKIDSLITKREDAEVALAGWRPSARILEPATPAQNRQPHLDVLGTFAGLLAGLLVALTWAQFRASRPQSARSGKTNQSLPQLSLPTLARMPGRQGDHQFATGHPLKPNLKGMAFAALRRLRVQLNLMGDRGWDTSLLGVVGMDQREMDQSGLLPSVASATTCGLALTHVLSGKRVLIVDAFVSQADLSSSMGLAAYPGLAECLNGEVDWRKNLVQTDNDQLDLLPAGSAPHAPDALYGSRAWTRLLQEFRGEYDVVLLRLPDLDNQGDLHQLTPKLGGVLLAADGKSLPHGEALNELLKPMRRTGTRFVGLFQANRGSTERAETHQSKSA